MAGIGSSTLAVRAGRGEPTPASRRGSRPAPRASGRAGARRPDRPVPHDRRRARRRTRARQTCGTTVTSGGRKPRPSSTRRHSAGSLKRKKGGPGGSGTSRRPWRWTARSTMPNATASSGLAQTVKPTRPPGAEDAVRLGQRLVRAREVQEPEAHDDRVEARVGERERLGVARLEVDPGVVPASLGQHRRREIDPHDRGPALGGRGRDVARPRRDVEHAGARAHPRGVQERPDRLGRQRRRRRPGTPGGCSPIRSARRRETPRGQRSRTPWPGSGLGTISKDVRKSMSGRRLCQTEQ